MAKWADFLISAVRYDANKAHIEKVRVHEDLGEQVGPAKESSRIDVLNNIKSGFSYVTILKTQNGKWQKGQEVHIIKVGNDEFIRTD
ncbi:MAG: hypothetical protein ACPLYF_02155, partial [Fervidobacterium sp.]